MTTMAVRQRGVRSDALPELLIENGQYRDTGCSVSSTCLACPLPVCRFDRPGGARAILNEARDANIRRARAEGESIDAISTRFAISTRSVFRILATT